MFTPAYSSTLNLIYYIQVVYSSLKAYLPHSSTDYTFFIFQTCHSTSPFSLLSFLLALFYTHNQPKVTCFFSFLPPTSCIVSITYHEGGPVIIWVFISIIVLQYLKVYLQVFELQVGAQVFCYSSYFSSPLFSWLLLLVAILLWFTTLTGTWSIPHSALL